MKKILVLAAFALFGYAGQAHAFGPNHTGFYVEPGVLYDFKGNGKIGAANPVTGAGDISGDNSGPGAEVRLGAHIHNIFFAGVEGTYLRDKLDAGTIKPEGNEWTAGVFAGLQMPWVVGLRVWGGYIPWAQVDYDRSNGYQPKFTDGRGWKVGAGLKLSIVSLNFEYMNLTYHGSDVNYNGGGNSTYQTGDPRYKHDAFMVGVSFPLDF